MNGSRDDTVEKLREISNQLSTDPMAEFKKILFPGWDKDFEEPDNESIRKAAKAILADDLSPDDGTQISQKELATLLHYIADMME